MRENRFIILVICLIFITGIVFKINDGSRPCYGREVVNHEKINDLNSGFLKSAKSSINNFSAIPILLKKESFLT